MDKVSNIINYLIMFLECFVWWRLIDNVLERKYLRIHTICAAVGLMILLILKDIVFEIPGFGAYRGYGTLILMIYSMICIQLLFRNSFIEKLIWWGCYYFTLIVMEILTILFLNLVMNKSLDIMLSDEISLFMILMGKLMLIPLFEMIIRRRGHGLVIGRTYFRELFAVILLNAVLFVYMVYIFNNKNDLLENIDNVILFMFGIVLFITVYTMILIYRLEKKSREDLETKLKMQQIELELKQNEDLVTITDKLRKLRHDMNNHIGLIKTLVTTGNYDELEDYVNQMYADVAIANDLVISGNRTVAVLVNAKKSMAKAKNIDFSSLITAQEINMQSKDICSLLGNILDNAIEAAEKSNGKKYIDLMIQRTEEGCVITCENSIGAKPMIRKGKFVTSKDNGELHGFGTESIKDIVAKYKGQLQFEYDEEIFCARVVMPV